MRLANHWRRKRPSPRSASDLSRHRKRVLQRYPNPRRLRSSRIPGQVEVGKPRTDTTLAGAGRPAWAPGRRPARNRSAARRCGTALRARPRDSAASRWSRAGRSASARHRASQFPASRCRAGRRRDPFPRRRLAAARASPRHSSACSRRASWLHERGILPAAGKAASGDSRSRSDYPIPRERPGVLPPPPTALGKLRVRIVGRRPALGFDE